MEDTQVKEYNVQRRSWGNVILNCGYALSVNKMIEGTIDESSPTVEQSEKIKIQLKTHQLASVCACLKAEENTKESIECNGIKFNFNFGILGNSVGSGKSYVILEIIAQNKSVPPSSSTIFTNDVCQIIKTSNHLKALPTNILVIPHNLLSQWKSYIQNTSLTCYFVEHEKNLEIFDKMNSGYGFSNYGKVIHDDLSEKQFNHELSPGAMSAEEFAEKYDLILVKSTVYNNFADKVNCYNFSRLIFDEMDSIKITNASKVESSFKWVVTSTFPNILLHSEMNSFNINRIRHNGFIKDLSDKISEFFFKLTKTMTAENELNTSILGYGLIHYNKFVNNLPMILARLSQFVITTKKSFIEKSFQLEQPIVHKVAYKIPGSFDILKEIWDEELMQLAEAGEMKELSSKLGLEYEEEKDIVKIATRHLQKELKNVVAGIKYKKEKEYSSKEVKEEAIKKLEKKKFEIESKIQYIKERIEEKECKICMEEFQEQSEENQKVIVKCCENTFCLKCAIYSLKTNVNCPCCRKRLSNQDIAIIGKMDQKLTIPSKESAFIETLQKIKSVPNHGVLIFSEYEQSLNNIREILHEQEIAFGNICGSSSHIAENIRKFNTREISVLLLNSKFFGAGLNLQSASHIILYHEMSKDVNVQVIGRAQRPGRTSQLEVFALCAI